MNLSILRQQYPNLRDYTDDEILQVVAGAAGARAGTPQYKALESGLLGYDRTAAEKVKDSGVVALQAAANVGRGAGILGAGVLPGVNAFDNPVTNTFDRWSKGLDEWKSSGLRAQEDNLQRTADIAEREAEARGAGVIGKVAANLGGQIRGYWDNPGLALQHAVAQGPMLAATMASGAATQLGARVVGAGAQTAARAGVAGAVGAGMGMQGTDVASETYDRMRQAGADYDTAASGAMTAGAKSAAATGLISMLPGGRTIERALVPGGRAVTGSATGRAMVGRTIGESTTEALEEGYGQYAGNQSVQQVDPSVSLWSGVGAAAGQGFIVSAPIAGVAATRHAKPAIRPTPTPTGELDMLTPAAPVDAGAYPADYETPAYQRRGLDPTNERSSPWPEGRPPAAPTYADLVTEPPAPTYADLMTRPSAALPADPYTAWDTQAQADVQRQAADSQQTRSGGQAMLQEQVRQYLAERQGQQAVPVQAPERVIAAGQGPGAVAVPVDVPGPVEQRPAAVGAAVDQARAQQKQALANGMEPNRGQVLAALQAASTALDARVVNKDGSVTKARSAEQLRGVLESKSPLAAMRELYQDGKAPRDELLDRWHEALTGQQIDAWKAAQAPTLNSAGFVPEPLPQVRAQIAAVRDGRKAVAVMGEQEARVVNAKGLARGVAVGPDGARAVVVAREQATVEQAVARAREVGLKVAMGEALGVANPTLTTANSGDIRAFQQVDNTSGQVIAEEVVEPADVPNVRRVPGTTPRLVPVEQAMADRLAAAQEPQPKREKKAPSLKRQSTDKIIQTVETAKDEAVYNDALYELYRRSADDTDDGVSYNYLDKNPPTATEQAMLKERFAAERGQARGRKFGAADGTPTKIAEARQVSNPDNGVNPLTAAVTDNVRNGQQAVQWLAANAKDPWHREIARRIARYIPADTKVTFLRSGDEVRADIARRLNAGAMAVAELHNDGRFSMFFHTGKNINESILLHELIHVATMRALQGTTNAALRAELQNILAGVRRTLRASAGSAAISDAGLNEAQFFDGVLENEDELLAYAFSSPAMRRWMEQMNANGDFVAPGRDAASLRRRAERRVPGVPPLTMWQRFSDAIRRLFGVPPRNQLAFERLLADREDTVAGIVRDGQDTSLYGVLDDLLQQAMDAQAGDGTAGVREAREAVAETPETAPYSRGAKEVLAYTKALAKGEELSPTLLNFMTVRQIGDQFGGKLPALREWASAVMERGATASKIAAEADRVALQWQQAVKDKAERKALADVLLRASNAELELDNTSNDYLSSLTPQERAEHAALRAKLSELSPEAQSVRQQALGVLKRQWDYTRHALETFINQTVADPGVRSARLDDLKQAMGRNRGDYFPMSRFGDRVVVARGAAADGRDVVTFHESAASLEAEVRRLKATGVRPSNIVVTQKGAYDPNNSGSSGFVRELHGLIDNTVSDGDTNRQMHEALQQLYLKSMPELSGAKHLIRREAVEGYSTDALRVFADAVARGSRYASHLEFAPRIQAALEAAEAQSRSADRRTAAVVIGRKEGAEPVVQVVATGTDRLAAANKLAADGYTVEHFNTVPDAVTERLEAAVPSLTQEQVAGYGKQLSELVGKNAEQVEDLRAAKQLHNHMVKLQRADGSEPSKAIEIAGQLGYAWYLGFSPAFWAMNTLQNPMIGIPHLGAKYGVTKASGEWMSAMKWFSGVRMGKLLADRTTPFSVEWLRDGVKKGEIKGLSKSELDMLQTLEDRQVLDFTQAADLSRIGAATDGPWYKAMRLAAAGAHHTEVFNRVSFALAAYRLALKSDGNVTHEEAVRRAENDVAAVHFDYSSANKPYAMGKGHSAARLVFMFQQYRQHMLYWWANTVKDATKGESPEVRSQARKAALLMGATNLMFAGTMGLPFIGAIGMLANLLGGADDGDEPFDFERWMLEAAVGLTGSQKAGEVVSKGVFAAMGMDISKRIGQGDLLPLLNEGSARFERNPDDKARAYLFDLLGPLGSIALGAARATESFSNGDALKALASMTPKAAADILKAYQLSVDGMKDKRGNYIATAEAFDGADAAIQALGVTPSSVANIRQARGAVADVRYAFQDQQKRLTGGFIEAWARGDTQGVTEALGAIQRYNANIAKGKYRDPGLLITQDRLASAVRDRQQRAMMLALTGGLAETRQQLLIATRMSGLYDTPPGAMGNQVGAPSLPGLPGLPGVGD